MPDVDRKENFRQHGLANRRPGGYGAGKRCDPEGDLKLFER